MFTKTKFLLKQKSNLPKQVQAMLSLPITDKIKNHFKSNDDVIASNKIPYELRGEYVPRRPINPFKKRPLSVIYDQSNGLGFVLPSRREAAYGMFDQEELFGIKRWRNDSPMIKEYIRIDNQLILLLIFYATFSMLYLSYEMNKKTNRREENLKLGMGIYSFSDLE